MAKPCPTPHPHAHAPRSLWHDAGRGRSGMNVPQNSHVEAEPSASQDVNGFVGSLQRPGKDNRFKRVDANEYDAYL